MPRAPCQVFHIKFITWKIRFDDSGNFTMFKVQNTESVENGRHCEWNFIVAKVHKDSTDKKQANEKNIVLIGCLAKIMSDSNCQ